MNDHDIVRFEQSRNLRYQAMLESLEGRLRSAARGVDRPISNEWVSKVLPTGGEARQGTLIGRVSLDRSDPLAGRDFYIGPRYIERDGITVFSWAAEVAATFFDPDGRGHELAQFVNARRTLAVRDGRVVGYEDNLRVAGLRAEAAFPLVSGLEIKKLPASAQTAPSRVGQSVTFPFRRPTRTRPSVAAGAVKPKPVQPRPPQTPAPPRNLRPHGLRARRTVVRSLEAPRGDRLSSVLATLQADQFNAVRESADSMWIFDGGPGTGKTVIGVHRACYLVDEAREADAVADVLVVGPTTGYQRHVSGVLTDLDRDGHVRVTSVAMLLTEIAGLSKEPVGSFARDLYEVEWERLEDCFVVADELRRTGIRPTTRTIYESLRERGAELGCDDRCKSLPPFKDARTWLRYLPLLAAVGLAAGGTPHRWAHVIVDEAQDVRPLEWAILNRLRSPRASFTVLGDLSQRRHHTGYLTWKNLVDDLRRDEPSLAATQRLMKRSYRSTAQILDYAKRLLPKNESVGKPLRLDGLPVITDEATDGAGAIQLAITTWNGWRATTAVARPQSSRRTPGR